MSDMNSFEDNAHLDETSKTSISTKEKKVATGDDRIKSTLFDREGKVTSTRSEAVRLEMVYPWFKDMPIVLQLPEEVQSLVETYPSLKGILAGFWENAKLQGRIKNPIPKLLKAGVALKDIDIADARQEILSFEEALMNSGVWLRKEGEDGEPGKRVGKAERTALILLELQGKATPTEIQVEKAKAWLVAKVEGKTRLSIVHDPKQTDWEKLQKLYAERYPAKPAAKPLLEGLDDIPDFD